MKRKYVMLLIVTIKISGINSLKHNYCLIKKKWYELSFILINNFIII